MKKKKDKRSKINQINRNNEKKKKKQKQRKPYFISKAISMIDNEAQIRPSKKFSVFIPTLMQN